MNKLRNLVIAVRDGVRVVKDVLREWDRLRAAADRHERALDLVFNRDGVGQFKQYVHDEKGGLVLEPGSTATYQTLNEGRTFADEWARLHQ